MLLKSLNCSEILWLKFLMLMCNWFCSNPHLHFNDVTHSCCIFWPENGRNGATLNDDQNIQFHVFLLKSIKRNKRQEIWIKKSFLGFHPNPCWGFYSEKKTHFQKQKGLKNCKFLPTTSIWVQTPDKHFVCLMFFCSFYAFHAKNMKNYI